MAVVEVVAGIAIIASAHIGFAILALLVGFAFIVNGVSMFLLGIAMHTVKRDTVEPPLDPPPQAPSACQRKSTVTARYLTGHGQ